MKETKTPTEEVGDQNVGKLKLPYSREKNLYIYILDK